jgi:predicted transcriptional regulator
MLFLSIHPEYVQAIIEGRKTVELRKRRPRAEIGSTVVIYATMPQCEVVATAVLYRIQSADPGKLWRHVRDASAVTKPAFDQYFSEAEIAVGIHFTQVRLFDAPIHLTDLRERWQGFHPPQQFRYLSESQQRYIGQQRTTGLTGVFGS